MPSDNNDIEVLLYHLRHVRHLRVEQHFLFFFIPALFIL